MMQRQQLVVAVRVFGVRDDGRLDKGGKSQRPKVTHGETHKEICSCVGGCVFPNLRRVV